MENKSKMPFGHYHDVQKPTTPVKVLLIAESRPEGGNYFYKPGESTNNSFFHGVMQAFGFEEMEERGEKQTKVKEDVNALLKKFLDHGYFLIDACPEPILKPIRTKKVYPYHKTAAIWKHRETLFQVIDDLKPAQIVFLCQTNESVAKWLVENHPLLGSKIVKNNDTLTFPYPGNSWLTLEPRKGKKKGILELLPDELKGSKR